MQTAASQKINTSQAIIELVRIRPWFCVLTFALWTLFYITPIAVGLLTREFFDAVSGDAPARFELGTIIALLIASELGRMLSFSSGV